MNDSISGEICFDDVSNERNDKRRKLKVCIGERLFYITLCEAL